MGGEKASGVAKGADNLARGGGPMMRRVKLSLWPAAVARAVSAQPAAVRESVERRCSSRQAEFAAALGAAMAKA